MPLAGLEPARCYPLDFESSASANSATAADAVHSHGTYDITFPVQLQGNFAACALPPLRSFPALQDVISTSQKSKVAK